MEYKTYLLYVKHNFIHKVKVINGYELCIMLMEYKPLKFVRTG